MGAKPELRAEDRADLFADWTAENFGLRAEVLGANFDCSASQRSVRGQEGNMNINNINSSHILKAIGEFDRLGRERFLANYGFGKAREYWLVYEGRRYDSKAIVGVGYQHVPGSTGPPTPADFVGGHATVQKLLEDLGFHVEVEKGERLEQG